MSQTISLILYTVKDLAAAKKLYSVFLEAEPYTDSPYYVGFKASNVEIGLTPGTPAQNQSSPVAYIDVSDIKATLQKLVEAGAQMHQEPKDVGGGMLVGAVKDADGNILGFRQLA